MVGIPGLDRRAMEAERLARLEAKHPTTTTTTISELAKATSSKRQRSITPPSLSRPTKKVKEQQDSSQSCQYPRGIIKQTWAFGHNRTANDIKIEEVLEKSTLRTALLSAFQWDTNWIMAKLNLKQTKVIMVMQAENEAIQQQYRKEIEYLGKILRLCFPSMQGNINCMHSKLMLLFHPHKLRIVIPSANLTSYDWGETGVMENSVFLIDLPRLQSSPDDSVSAFGQELLFFLEKMGCDEDVRKGVLNFDFGNTKHLAFVHSIGGAHYGTDMERTGHVGLSKAIRELSPDQKTSLVSQANLEIDYAASSIGSLNDEFLTIIHNAARGEDATTLPTKTSRKPPTPFQSTTTSTANIRDVFRIYFPTHDTVTNSTGGSNNGGTICLQSKWWKGEKFPRSCFRDYRSKRRGMLSHNKILYARGLNGKGEKVAWQYVGSANLSESAWGKVSWDRTRKQWKIGCRNWECGVVVSAAAEKKTEDAVDDKDVIVLSSDDGDAVTDSGAEDAESDSGGGDAETESEDEQASKIGKRDGKTGLKSEKGKKASDKRAVEKKIPDMHVFNTASGAGIPFEYPGAEYAGKDPWFFMG